MRPTNRLFLFALIIFLLFGTVPVVHAVLHNVTCDESPQSGSIDQLNTQDTYNIWLDAGQKLIIDVDADKIGSTLDSYLVVSYSNGDEVGFSDKSTDVGPDADTDESEDPYLEITADVDDTYTLTISAAGDGTSASDEGSYTLLFECSVPGQSTPSEFTWPVVVGDLLGATGFDTGSLINITPANAKSTLPFPLGVSPIVDIEFDPTSDFVFVAVDTAVAIDDAVAVDAAVAVENIPAKIVALDPKSGNEVKSYSLETESVVALEAAENELYGVQVDPTNEKYNLVLVTFDDSDPTDPTATLAHVAPLAETVYALAYHSVEKVMYGVVAGAAGSSGSELVQIDLTSGAFVPMGDPGAGVIVALDFSHDNLLFGADLSGNLHEIDLTTGLAKLIGEIDVSAKVSGLTFVVGEPPDDEPIKTMCSSTLASQMAADSESADHKLSKFKLRNHLGSGAVGLFKFQAAAGENIIIKLTPEVEEVAAAEEESSVSELNASWPRWHWRHRHWRHRHWKGEGRLFLGLRDAIPGVKRRERIKGTLPLELAVENLAEGQYYIMVIQPLFRSNKVDYCLTMESDYDDSQAWESLEVAWPSDDSDDDSASTSAAEPEDVQKSTETVASASADDSPVPVALSTTAIAPAIAPFEEPVVVTPVGADPDDESGR